MIKKDDSECNAATEVMDKQIASGLTGNRWAWENGRKVISLKC